MSLFYTGVWPGREIGREGRQVVKMAEDTSNIKYQKATT